MAKNDKFKEELAENRHNELMVLMLGSFGLAGLAVAIAYAAGKEWTVSLPFYVVIAIGYLVAYFSISRNRRIRKTKIKRLDK